MAESVINPAGLARLPFLNAVINESLRLQPLVASGVQRVLTSPNGVVISGNFIPCGTTVQVSTYSVQRNPANFYPNPDKFCPDRWLSSTSTDNVLNKEGFFPFSQGPTGCPGKQLALMEMRAVTAALLLNFDLFFCKNWDPNNWEKNLKDFYTIHKGSMPVELRLRAQRA